MAIRNQHFTLLARVHRTACARAARLLLPRVDLAMTPTVGTRIDAWCSIFPSVSRLGRRHSRGTTQGYRALWARWAGAVRRYLVRHPSGSSAVELGTSVNSEGWRWSKFRSARCEESLSIFESLPIREALS